MENKSGAPPKHDTLPVVRVVRRPLVFIVLNRYVEKVFKDNYYNEVIKKSLTKVL
jgi:hypothetical protein